MTITIYGTNNDDTLQPPGPNDPNVLEHLLIKGFDGDDTIYDGIRDDTLMGGDGNDHILQGSDQSIPFGGNNIVNGGAGNDIIFFHDLSQHDTLIGGEGHDSVIGSKNTRSYGNEGDDVISGGSFVRGGAGSDHISAGRYDSDLFGGTGVDSFSFSFSSGVRSEIHDFDAAAGESITISYYHSTYNNSPVITSNSNGDAVIRTEFPGKDKHYITLKGVDANDLEVHEISTPSLFHLFQIDYVGGDETGNQYGDTLNGTSGDNTLYGFLGDDTLLGGAGNDELIGGHHHDRLEGGAGNDTLIGGTGQDYLIGGTGADIFSFSEGDSYQGHGTRDAIKDFELGVDFMQYEGGGVPAGALDISMAGAYTSLHFTDANFQIRLFGDFTTEATADIGAFFV